MNSSNNNSLLNIQSLAGFNINYSETTTSTNTNALQAANNGANHLTTFIAERQTAGRGRSGKKWQTFPYKSIACSVVVKTGGSDMLPLVACLAINEAIFNATGIKTDIKWPNDLLINNQKIAGILVEKIQYNNNDIYILGFGLNVFKVEDFASLADFTENDLSREKILLTTLQTLNNYLNNYVKHGWSFFKETYEKKCITIGKQVTLLNGEKQINGIAKRLTDDASLVLATPNGEYFIRSGDIIAQGGEK